MQKRYMCAVMAVVVLFGVAGCAMCRSDRRAGGLRLLLHGERPDAPTWPDRQGARVPVARTANDVKISMPIALLSSPRYG